jgi:DNA-binding response OmpR family regulator
LTLLGVQAVDLILLDVMMPEMDGYEALLKLKEGWRDLPVIMISALDEIESVVRCIERGAEDYLPKPFDPVLLRARIGACLEKKRLRDQEVSYLKDVGQVTHAAAAIEAGEFTTEILANVGNRPDELGQLARVFERMAHEIAAREQQLKQQIQVLSIEIDQAKRARQVSEITETEYFQELRKKAKELRSKP